MQLHSVIDIFVLLAQRAKERLLKSNPELNKTNVTKKRNYKIK